MYQELVKKYRDLETRVLGALREEIGKSNVQSKHMDTPVIPVNVFGYTELAIINDRHTFMDGNGEHYSLWADCGLEDLIDILNKLEE